MMSYLRQGGVILGVLIFALSALWCSIDLHYCQGDLKSFSFIGEAPNCHEMAKKNASCHHHNLDSDQDMSCNEDEGNCCHHSTYLLENDIQQIAPQVVINPDFDQVSLPGIFAMYEENLVGRVLSPIEYLNFKPPLIAFDLFILFQSFLL